MAVVNYEWEFMVGLLDSPKIMLERSQRVGFEKWVFEDKDLGKVFELTQKLQSTNSEINHDSIDTFIAINKSMGVEEKVILRNKVRDLYKDLEKNGTELGNFSFYLLSQHVKTQLFARELKQTMTQMLSDPTHDINDIITRVHETTKKLQDRNEISDVTLYNSVENWTQRKAQRSEQAIYHGNSIHITGNLSILRHAFARGFEPGTISSVGGNTGVGKSILLTNIALMAISPPNSLNGLYVIAENRKIQSESRLDSVLLNHDYTKLWTEDQDPNNEGEAIFGKMQDWGKLFTVKVTVNKFDVNDIISIFEDEFIARGIKPQFLIIDSPDHMEPTKWSPKKSERKAEVYNDLKGIVDRYHIPVITSLPMQAAAAKKKDVSAEDAAGSYDISKICDNQLFFIKSTEDDLLGRRTIQVVKNRDGQIPVDTFRFKLKNSLKFEEWDDTKIGKAYELSKPVFKKGDDLFGDDE